MVFHEAPQVLLPQTLLNQALLRERLGKGTWCLLYGKHVILFNLCDNPVKWHLNSCVIDTETAAELCCQSHLVSMWLSQASNPGLLSSRVLPNCSAGCPTPP